MRSLLLSPARRYFPFCFLPVLLPALPLSLCGQTVSAEASASAPAGPPVNQPDPAVTRGPYLQAATASGIKIVWRTRTAGMEPGVQFGLRPDALDTTLAPSRILIKRPADELPDGSPAPALSSAPDGTRQFEADLTGLRPDTLYYYTVTGGGKPLHASGPDYTFRTLPEPGTPRDGLFWVVGDSGTGNRVQLQVHDAMRQWLAKEKRTLDGYLHVGDMAYGSGLDSEFQGYFFESYASTLRHTVCWPSMGNHEGRHSSGATATGPYFDAYIVPTGGESGGLASGTESYYSFDFGRIHFICLNSHDLPRDPAGTMAQWLKADLEKTRADWLVAFWHHPPYTKGSHDSDREKQLVEMRSLIMPILESGGVDLVLTGHSHIYERSMLMDGAYATPTVAENVILDDGDGNPAGDGPYKKSEGLTPNNGTVQIVAGHGGTTLSRKSNPSPVMRTTVLEFGSVLLDFKGNTLNAIMLNNEGKVRDTFQLIKAGQVPTRRIASPWKPPLLTGPRILPLRGAGPGGDDDGPKTVKLSPRAVAIIPPSSDWQYLAGGHKPGYGWQEPGFDAAGWLTGPAGFGYGDKDDATLISGMRNNYRWICIRREFELTGHEDLTKFRLAASYDDGFVAYLNGREILRLNVESGSLDTVRGVSSHEANRQTEIYPVTIPRGVLNIGKNVLAIEGHNDDLGSSDFTLHPAFYFDPSPPDTAADRGKTP